MDDRRVSHAGRFEWEMRSVTDLSRRDLMGFGTALAGVAAIGGGTGAAAQGRNGFMAASSRRPGGLDDYEKMGPGLQRLYALCEVTGGGEKVYGVAVKYDAPVDQSGLDPHTYSVGVVPATKGFFPNMPDSGDKKATAQAAVPRAVAAIYTNAEPALRPDQKSMPGPYVIAEFAHDADLSLPTTDSDRVMLTQDGPVQSTAGATYAASATAWSNSGRRGNTVVIRGVDDGEQSHWWWDDTRSAWLEYSIYLPKSFLEPGGEARAYPLVLAVTHSGTSYNGTCAQTLTEQCIATIWSLPEEQARHECVVITPRYERTTMNDYWEHTSDVENTFRLVESLMRNTWNYGNPNLPDRADKVLKIDP